MLTDTLGRIRDITSRMADCDQADDGSLYLMALDLDTLAEQAEREADALISSLKAFHEALCMIYGMFPEDTTAQDTDKIENNNTEN